MNRKLLNSLSAVTASGAALAIVLMVAVPAGRSPVLEVVSPMHAGEVAMAQAGQMDALTRTVLLSARGRAESHGSRKAPKHRRQTAVMPYFSFLPRG